MVPASDVYKRQLECSSAGKYYLESGKTPEGVSSVELTQCEDSFQLRMKLEC